MAGTGSQKGGLDKVKCQLSGSSLTVKRGCQSESVQGETLYVSLEAKLGALMEQKKVSCKNCLQGR